MPPTGRLKQQMLNDRAGALPAGDEIQGAVVAGERAGRWSQGGQGTDLKANEVNQSTSGTLGAEMTFSQLLPCPKQLTYLK